jgi:hypothetical protein
MGGDVKAHVAFALEIDALPLVPWRDKKGVAASAWPGRVR